VHYIKKSIKNLCNENEVVPNVTYRNTGAFEAKEVCRIVIMPR